MRFIISAPPMPVDKGLIPALEPASVRPPEQPEHRARGASGMTRSLGCSRSTPADPPSSAAKYISGEPHPPQHRLEELAELVQQRHVEGEVEQAEVDEPVEMMRYHSAVDVEGRPQAEVEVLLGHLVRGEVRRILDADPARRPRR